MSPATRHHDGDAARGRRADSDVSSGLPPLALVFFGALALLSFGLGFWGLCDYVRDHPDFHGRPIDIAYYDLQLFIINSNPVSNGGPYPLPLEIARFSAPLTTAYALILTLGVVLEAQWRQLRVRLTRRHAIVCGSGPAALLLGQRLRREGRRVVLVDRDGSLRGAHALRLLRVSGDPRDELVLRRAGARRAAEVFVLQDDSAASAATVFTLARMVRKSGSPTCYAAIADREVYEGLNAMQFGPSLRNREWLRLFNLDELAAQVVLRLEPAWKGTDDAHVLVVGLGALGEALALELARAWRVATPLDRRHLTLTLVDANALEVAIRVDQQVSMAPDRFEARPRAGSAADLDDSLLADLMGEGSPPGRVYVCCDDDTTALRVGFRALRYLHGARIVVCVERGAALRDAFHGEQRVFDAWGTLAMVGLEELLMEPEQIRRGPLVERLARGLHESYFAACKLRGEVAGERPALVPWDELPEELRESNRHQAMDVGEKLETIGCRIVPASDLSAGFKYRGDEEWRLARLEHDRWVRERVGRGHVAGIRRNGHVNPDLVPWEELTETAKDKDVRFIRELPVLLADAGFHIKRRDDRTPPD